MGQNTKNNSGTKIYLGYLAGVLMEKNSHTHKKNLMEKKFSHTQKKPFERKKCVREEKTN